MAEQPTLVVIKSSAWKYFHAELFFSAHKLRLMVLS